MPTLIDEESGERLRPLRYDVPLLLNNTLNILCALGRGLAPNVSPTYERMGPRGESLSFCEVSPVLAELLRALMGQVASSIAMYGVGYTSYLSVVIDCLERSEGQQADAALQQCEGAFNPIVGRNSINNFGIISSILYLGILSKIGYDSLRFINLARTPQNGFDEHCVQEYEEGVNRKRKCLMIAGVVLLIYAALYGDTQAYFHGHDSVKMDGDISEAVDSLSNKIPLGLTGSVAEMACILFAIISVSISVFENVSGVNTAIDGVTTIAEGFLERLRIQNRAAPAAEVMR